MVLVPCDCWKRFLEQWKKIDGVRSRLSIHRFFLEVHHVIVGETGKPLWNLLEPQSFFLEFVVRFEKAYDL